MFDTVRAPHNRRYVRGESAGAIHCTERLRESVCAQQFHRRYTEPLAVINRRC